MSVDIIIDLIEEMNQEQYTKQYIDAISNFSVPDMNNNGIVVGTSDIPNEMENSDMVDVHVVDSSNQVVSCETVYSDVTKCNNSYQ